MLTIELEAAVWGYVDAANASEERRLIYDLAERDLLGELIDAIWRLLDGLGEETP